MTIRKHGKLSSKGKIQKTSTRTCKKCTTPLSDSTDEYCSPQCEVAD